MGELVSTGGGAGFEGYWRNDEAELARLRNGWYWTGDLAYRDEAGLLLLRGPVRRLAAGGRGELRGGTGGTHLGASPRRRPGRGVRRARPRRRRPGHGGGCSCGPGTTFDAEEFGSFLASQSDLGTKWAPRFVRVCPELPITATSKVLVRTLRSERWNCSDPVWWRPRGTGSDRRLTDADAAGSRSPSAIVPSDRPAPPRPSDRILTVEPADRARPSCHFDDGVNAAERPS